jgi:hypothetical protein
MKIDLNTAIDLALSQARESTDQDRESLMIMDTMFPNQHPGADLGGWALFMISVNGVIDSPIHVGVHMDTGETKIIEVEE